MNLVIYKELVQAHNERIEQHRREVEEFEERRRKEEDKARRKKEEDDAKRKADADAKKAKGRETRARRQQSSRTSSQAADVEELV
jgi:hypothetical protein